MESGVIKAACEYQLEHVHQRSTNLNMTKYFVITNAGQCLDKLSKKAVISILLLETSRGVISNKIDPGYKFYLQYKILLETFLSHC